MRNFVIFSAGLLMAGALSAQLPPVKAIDNFNQWNPAREWYWATSDAPAAFAEAER